MKNIHLKILLPSLLAALPAFVGAESVWTGNISQAWDEPDNWDLSCAFPNACDAGVRFHGANVGVVSLNQAISLGSLTFTAGGYTIEGNGGALTFLISEETPAIDFSSGNANNAIRSDIYLDYPLSINNTSAAELILSGAISGAGGSIVKKGISPLTLSGANTYGGGTQIQAGALKIGTTDNLGTGDVVFIGNGTLSFTAEINPFDRSIAIDEGVVAAIDVGSGDSSLGGDIADGSGPGILRKLGSGTLTLSAFNTYSGGTQIGEGTVSIRSRDNIGSGPIVFTGNGALSFSRTIEGFSRDIAFENGATGTIETISDGSLRGVLSGPGALEKSGSGILVLENSANSYSGGTKIRNGTLQAGADYVIPPSGTVALSANAVLDLNGFAQTIGHLSGPADSLVLLGSNSEQSLTVGDDTDRVFAGVISGSGGIVKKGGGLLTLLSANAYTGPTTVAEGTLSVNGSLASALAVQSGAALKGTGILQAVAVQAGGTIAPGNSIGTLTVDTLDLNADSITLIEIDPFQSSSIQVSGLAMLGGSVQVLQQEGSYPATNSYPILTAGSISGSFSPTVLGGSPGFHFSLVQETDTVSLVYEWTPPPDFESLYDSDDSYSHTYSIPLAGLSGQIAAFARYLNDSVPDSQVIPLLEDLPLAALENALISASAARNAFAAFSTQNLLLGVSQLASSHLADQRFFHTQQQNQQSGVAALFSDLTADRSDRIRPRNPCDKYSFWANGFGEYSHLNAQSLNPAFNAYSAAAMLGCDFYGLERNLFGAGAGYAYTHLVEKSNAGREKINTYFALLYYTFYASSGYLELGAWGAYNQVHNYRQISFPGFGATASATIHAWQLVPHLGFGYRAQFCWGAIEPFAQFDCAVNWQASFQEHGAGPFNMFQRSQTSELLRSEAGLRFYQSKETDWGAWMIKEKISYANLKTFQTGRVVIAIARTSNFFTFETFRGVQNLGSAGLEFLWRFGKNKPVAFSLAYEGEWGSRYMMHEAMFKIVKDF